MQIITVQFDQNGTERYAELLKVFRYSVKKHMPDVAFNCITIPEPKWDEGKEKFMVKNTVKLHHWVKAVEEATENTLIMDCDMLVIKDMSSVFDMDFDIAFTGRTLSKIPMNGGVLCIKPNERSIEFMRLWEQVNFEMYNNKEFHNIWRHKYAGMNQASFGCTFEEGKYTTKVISIPCPEWNVCQEDWSRMSEKARCIHIKSRLRRCCIDGYKPDPKCEAAYHIWKQYQKEANAEF